MAMPNDVSPRSPLIRGITAALALVVVGLAVVYVVRARSPQAPGGGEAGDRTPGPTFLNTAPDVAFTGVDRCASCHAPRYASYLETNHSRSLSVLDPSKEDLPGAFHHLPSDLHYRMYEQDGAMHVAESLRLDSGETETLADHASKYLIGSGSHSRSYLAEIDGFLHEAPVTWYASKKAWDISPGYDRTLHLGFGRPTGQACIACHVGRAETIGGSVNKFHLLENAIGCERCHGPGALHEAKHRGKPATAAGTTDLTIVDPKHLDRDQNMDLCAQCHMDHTLTVIRPGKRPSDWRPGKPWNEVQVTYRPKPMWQGMTVVGHVDQLRQSACFEGSETLSCLTCHSPHGRTPSDGAAKKRQFNGKCLTCHEHCARLPDDGPGIVPPEGDDCVKCHMPRGDTDIPHIAFTHHRIGLHGVMWEKPEKPQIPELHALGDISHVPPMEQKRNLGLAYLQLSSRAPYPQQVFAILRGKARTLLEEAYKEGWRDAEMVAALARVRLAERKLDGARELARSALELAKTQVLSPERRADCLSMLAGAQYHDKDYEGSLQTLAQLTLLRRDAQDHMLVMNAYRRLGNLERAAEAARQALSIWPENPDLHYEAADLFGEMADTAARDRHNLIGRKIHMQQSLGARLLEERRKKEK